MTHGLQHTRLPCASLSHRVCSNSSPLSRWCQPTISSSVTSFFSCPQSFPASGSFPMSQLFTSDGQTIGASAPASVLPMNIQGWFLLGLTGVISVLSKRLSRLISSTVRKHSSSVLSLLYGPTLRYIHDYWKNHRFDYMDLCLQSDVSAFQYAVYVYHRFSSKELVSFNFIAAVTVRSDSGAQENKVCHCFHCFPIYFPWSNGTKCHDLHFLNVDF